jgi:sulfur carrier protein ThiS
MQILMINNDGGGFADHMDINEGTTVAQLFADKLPSQSTKDYLIRVNRQPIPREYTLQDGDRVTITPTKIEGAA